MNVSACLVTRGNVDMTEILTSLAGAGIGDIVIWNNLLETDLGVAGRYAAIEQARFEVVYVQDDDCVLPAESIHALIDAYEPGRIVANMPLGHRRNYRDACLIGFGAVFDRDLPALAFERFGGKGKRPDIVFTALTPHTLLDVPFKHLPWATGPDRMYRQPGHVFERDSQLRAARRVRNRRSVR